MTDLVDLLKLKSDQEQEYWYQRSVPANTTLLYEGDIADKVYFVKRGALRLWNNDDGKDITLQFFFEGQIVTSYESFYLQKPSMLSIETIEDTEVLVLDNEKLALLMNESPDLLYFIIDQLSKRFIAYTEYFLSRIKNSPEKRYLSLVKENTELVRRVPDHYIASFLGITPVSLSRIKKEFHKLIIFC